MKGKRNSQQTYKYDKKEAHGNSSTEKYNIEIKISLDKLSLKEMARERKSDLKGSTIEITQCEE